MRPVTAWLLAALTVPLAVAAALTLEGPTAFGRLALSLGLPGPAAALLHDPLWQGIALYRAGDFDQAAEAFRQAGPRASYNRGNALARAGRYGEAVAAYDAVLYRDPRDRTARANRALVAALVTETVGEARAGGRIAASGTASGPAGERRKDVAKGPPPKVSEVRKGFSGQSIVASRQWLATLADEPGRYLKLRLAAEHDRRRASGLGAPPAEDPW